MPQPPKTHLSSEQYDAPHIFVCDMYGADSEVLGHVVHDSGGCESAQTVAFWEESKDKPENIDSLVAGPQIEGTSLLKSEVSDVLNTWLNEEMKTYIQSIDTKLERLLSLHSSSRSSGWKSANSKDSKATTKSSHVHLAALAELKKMEKADDVRDLDRGSVKTNASAIQRLTMFKNRAGSTSSLHVPRKTFQAKGTDEIREIIEEYADQRSGCVVNTWRFLEDPHSSPCARIYAAIMAVCTIFSVFVTFWQSVEGCPLSRSHASIINVALEIAFSTEIIARFIVSGDRTAFWHNLYNYIDLISSLPLPYRGVAIILGSAGIEHDTEEILSKFAFVPVLRLFRLMRHFESFQLLMSAFLLAVEVLPVLLYTLSILALVFSALIRIVEPSENIENLPQALWFVIVTMTTVGYGDVTPETTMGKIVTSMLMIVSMLYMAIPIGIVGNAFSQVWEARDRLLLMPRMREAFIHSGFNAKTLRGIVQQFDLDKDGFFSLEEFKAMLKAMRINMSDERVLLLMDSMDENGCGAIDLDELMKGLFPRDFHELLDSMALKNARRSNTPSRDTSFSPQASSLQLRPTNTNRSTIAQIKTPSSPTGNAALRKSSPPRQSSPPRDPNLAAPRPTICSSS